MLFYFVDSGSLSIFILLIKAQLLSSSLLLESDRVVIRLFFCLLKKFGHSTWWWPHYPSYSLPLNYLSILLAVLSLSLLLLKKLFWKCFFKHSYEIIYIIIRRFIKPNNSSNFNHSISWVSSIVETFTSNLLGRDLLGY